MKNTLITALALCTAAFAYGEDVTISTSGSETSAGTYYGWYTSLEELVADGVDLATTVALTQVTITTPSNIAEGEVDTSTSVKLAIYTANVDGDGNISIGDFAALSANSVTFATDTTLDFNFANVTLETSAVYFYVFVSESVTTDDLSGATAADNDTLFRTSLYTTSSQSTTSGVLHYSGEFDTSIVPVVTYTVSTVASVPEPTTATLSLLALAGLAARRRRK